MIDLFKELVFDVIVKEAIRRLLIQIPLLSISPLSHIATHFLVKFCNSFYEYQKTVVKFYKFEFMNEANQKAFERQFIELKELENNPDATKEEKQKALQAAKNHLAYLVRHS